MKKMTKFLCLALALVMCFGIVACKKVEDTPKDTGTKAPEDTKPPVKEESDQEILDRVLPISGEEFDSLDAYGKESRLLYREILGDFYVAYTKATEAKTVSERYALMAIAEAKLLESGVMMPSSCKGGNYAIGRVVPYTATPVLWGNDSDRFYKMLVVSGDPIKSADRDALKSLYKAASTATEYYTKAKAYLTEKGYTLKNTYNMGYSTDPDTWDVLATSKAVNSEAIVNTYDGLLEYDAKNNLQPALAESYTVSEDGLTYTFKIRKGVKWVDAQGKVVADVKADDFVAGMQHMMDANGGLGYLIEGLIVGATGYLNGDITDFSEVGVKAIDDYTLEYKLEKKATYFLTMLGYGVFAPMSRAFYQSKGGKFGADFDKAATDYTYGKDYNSIAYCGPYLVRNATSKSTIVFEANPSYWNKDAVEIKTLTWLYNNGKDATKAYVDMKAGVLDGAGLNASSLELAKGDGWFEMYHYVSGTDATAFMAFLNVNRKLYANFNDPAKAVSTITADADKERAAKAMQNKHFRTAIMYSLDRKTYNAQTQGDELALTSLINSYTPGTFVKLEEAVTVKINGVEKTYAKDTYYGQIVQDQITADGYKYKVWDPTADGGIGSSAGFDGWLNVEEAKKELEKAIAELGIEITAENPIKLDLPCFTGSEVYKNRAQAFKQSLEKALDGKVILNLVECPNSDDWYDAGYNPESGNEMNYSIYDVSGWGPDYGDPASYLDTFLPEGSGYMSKSIGLY